MRKIYRAKFGVKQGTRRDLCTYAMLSRLTVNYQNHRTPNELTHLYFYRPLPRNHGMFYDLYPERKTRQQFPKIPPTVGRASCTAMLETKAKRGLSGASLPPPSSKKEKVAPAMIFFGARLDFQGWEFSMQQKLNTIFFSSFLVKF